MNNSQKILDDLTFVVIDLETTGGNQASDKIIEIGLVKIQKQVITDEMHHLVDPEIPVPVFIQNLTSITPDKLENAPKIEELIEKIIDFIGDSIIVAHNVSFDLPFLNSVLKRLDRPELENKSLCTNLMTKYVIPNILSSNLNYMSQIFDIPHDKAHRALEDAQACARLLLKYLEIFAEKGIRKVNQLYYPRNKFELDRIHVKADNVDELSGRLKGLKSCAYLSFKGDNGLLLGSVVLTDPEDEMDIVRTLTKQTGCTTITLQLIGSFFEGFLLHNLHANKYEEDVRKITLEYFCKQHLNKSSEEIQYKESYKELLADHFLISKHLVPGQLVIYPLFNLQYRNELIFRYPGHKKRIMHYTNGQIKRVQNAKKNVHRGHINKELLNFMCSYLEKTKGKQQPGVLFIKKDTVQNEKGKIFNLIHNFLIQNKDTYNYPKEHI